MTIQTSGCFDEITGIHTINIAFDDNHVITLDGLSKEDMEELKSCIECMLLD